MRPKGKKSEEQRTCRSKRTKRTLTSMDNVHGAHGTASIVEHPLLVQVDIGRVHTMELRDNVVNNGLGVVTMLGNSALRKVMQMLVIEDVEFLKILLKNVVNGEDSTQKSSDEEEPASKAVGIAWRRHRCYRDREQLTSRECTKKR